MLSDFFFLKDLIIIYIIQKNKDTPTNKITGCIDRYNPTTKAIFISPAILCKVIKDGIKKIKKENIAPNKCSFPMPIKGISNNLIIKNVIFNIFGIRLSFISK
jgi:hypothetical protein